MTRHFQNHEGQKEKLLRLLKKRRKTHGVGGALLDTFSDPNGSLVLSNLEWEGWGGKVWGQKLGQGSSEYLPWRGGWNQYKNVESIV